MLIIRCFGGTAAWEGPGSPLPEDSDCITHQVVDRPSTTHRRLGRQYIQPQWLFDCANFRVTIAAADYAPGTVAHGTSRSAFLEFEFEFKRLN
jgi:pescadillo